MLSCCRGFDSDASEALYGEVNVYCTMLYVSLDFSFLIFFKDKIVLAEISHIHCHTAGNSSQMF